MTAKETSSIGNEANGASRSTAKKAGAPTARAKSTTTRSAGMSGKTASASPGNGKRPTSGKPRKKAYGTKPVIAPEERQRMISQAAWLISRRRGHTPGNPDTDWIHAETVIDMIFDVA